MVKKQTNAVILNHFLHNNKFWLPFWLLFGAVICSLTKFDFFWDFENYHFYNPWKMLDSDNYHVYMPAASINSFLNPLLDVPLYLLIKYFNDFPTFIYAMQGLWFGALIFVFHKIALLFFNECSYRNFCCFWLTILIAITGQATWYQSGSSTNEIPIAFLVLSGIYFGLKLIIYPSTQKSSTFLFLGLLMGITLGLKQTSLSYTFALGLSFILFYKNLQKPMKYIGLYTLGGFIGCLASYGFVMYENFSMYGNPFLPFLNSFFQSEYFDSANFHDTRFIPSILQFFYYPYLWEDYAAEVPFKDKRGAIFYTICWMFLLYAGIYYLIKKKSVPFFSNILNRFTCVWLLISYLLWSIFFSIFRYLIPMEMFFAIFIVKTANYLLFQYRGVSFAIPQLACLELLLFHTLSVPFRIDWDEAKTLRQNQYLQMETVKLPENTLVKLYNLPIGFMIPMLARDNQSFSTVIYVDSAYGMNTDFTERNKFAQIREDVVAKHTGPVVIVAATSAADEAITKYERLNNPENANKPDLDEIDLSFLNYRKNLAQKELIRRHKGMQRSFTVDSTLKEMAASSYNLQNRPKFLLNNDEMRQMYCRYLDINIAERLVICVPKELKDSILNPQASERMEQKEEQRRQKYRRLHQIARFKHEFMVRKEMDRLGLE